MTSRERVYATLDFTGPDRLPTDFWPLPSTWYNRREAVDRIVAKYPCDFHGTSVENVFNIDGYTAGALTDVWGCEWLNLQDGVIGEVKRAPLTDYAALRSYRWPEVVFGPQWQNLDATLAANRDRFSLGWVGDIFERMQFLRGPENLYIDLADEDCGEVYELRDRLAAMMRSYTERWARSAVDAIFFSDDWGSQRSLLISPRRWREFYKPVYRELFALARDAGKRVFFHSDGWIVDIYPDLIEMGANAINSQVWCMGLDTLAPFAGKVTFWGELDRQQMLPHGTPEQIRAAAREMAGAFYRNGGLIGQSSVDKLSSLANVEAALACWWEIPLR